MSFLLRTGLSKVCQFQRPGSIRRLCSEPEVSCQHFYLFHKRMKVIRIWN